ncbi:MAG: 3'-5' exonuclease [Pseudomonadota bacterium]
MTRLSLRLRVFLFFCLLAVGALVIVAGALALGWYRSDPPVPLAPFITAFVAFGLINSGLLLGVWLLFDENVAKPINRLSANLRMRAHADVANQMDAEDAQYLGDLAPAAAALGAKAGLGVEEMAASVARETERLAFEHKRLSALLTASPIGTILVNPAREIVLYDAQAASVLSGIRPPRLKAPLSDFFEADEIEQACTLDTEQEHQCQLRPVTGSEAVTVRIKKLNGDGYILFFDPSQQVAEAQIAARPLVFDFDLMHQNENREIDDLPLDQLVCVVLDLETTGLSVAEDAIVQIGAVRVMNGIKVAGEEISCYVNPGRPIPPSSTRIHHVTDADVAQAPTIAEAGRQLYDFSKDAVLVAHNAPFDIGLLKRHEAEIGAAWDHPVLDTVLLSAVAFGATEEHSLDALCDRLGIRIDPKDRHTALGDAHVTADALVCLLHMLKGQGYENLGALKEQLDRHAHRLYAAS